MKIEIDLNDILGGYEGDGSDGPPETLQESVRRQVIDKMSLEVKKGIGDKIDEAISKLINDTLQEQVKEITPQFINQVLDAEYVAIDRWGSRSQKPTTFRAELIREINEQMVYKSNSRYDSEKNAFTRAIDGVLENEMKKFKELFNSKVDSVFVKQTFEYAVKTLREKLGMKEL